MAASAGNLVSRVKAHYDKAIASVVLVGLLSSLLYLAVKVGTVRGRLEDFEHKISQIEPAHPHAAAVDVAPFEEGLARIEDPFLGQWTNWVFLPEERVWCVDCKRPIPMRIAETQGRCPFCDFRQPVDYTAEKDYDGDQDGMWDSWEVTYNLDTDDAEDAMDDPDGDGFTNIEEFRATPPTDPTDAEDYPPFERKLGVIRIEADPFMLRFRSAITLPGGVKKFGLNLELGDRQPQTFFRKMHEKVQGFELVEYEEKTEMRERPGWPEPRPVDASILTLQRGDRRIPLEKGKDVQHDEYTAHLYFSLDKKKHALKINESLELRGSKYTLIRIDSRGGSVVIRREEDGQEFDVPKLSPQEAGNI